MKEYDNLSSLIFDEGLAEGIQTVAPRAMMHFAIIVRINVDLVVGGIHYMQGDAERIRETIARRTEGFGAHDEAAKWRSYPIEEIAVGQPYNHWMGEFKFMDFRHGEDDVMHESILKFPFAKPYLKGTVIP